MSTVQSPPRLHGGPWDGRYIAADVLELLGERQTYILETEPGQPRLLYSLWADGLYHYQGETE